jgi:hypothetical protein
MHEIIAKNLNGIPSRRDDMFVASIHVAEAKSSDVADSK